MSEQPATIAREAKSIHQSLKELLKAKDPYDKEVDFQRKNLRRRYLNLLLVHPNTKESKDVENHLWMQTSYAFIASYKQRIAALDRAIQNNQRPHQPQQPQQRQNHHGPVEHRKLVQRFRQFLADEEKFWTQLVLRLRRLFDLKDAQPALIALGLLSETDEVPAPSVVAGAEGAEVRDGVMHVSNGRNHFQFPPEDLSVSFAPTSVEERDSRLATLSKALICLGDIARYRELYNESGGRPRLGHEDPGPAKRGRSRRGGGPADPIPRLRNYDKSQQCYEQARLLVPDEGNPSHQLAILASYQKDSFASINHYYRALGVRQPYDTASENLGTVLSKALETWKGKNRRERDKGGINETQLPPRVRIEMFKERVVTLHALWRLGVDKGIAKMESIAPDHSEKVFSDFYGLVAERHVPTDMISNTVVLAQGALWKHRMIRDTPPTPHHRKQEPVPAPPETSVLVEWSILSHLLDLHIALLEVGKDELKDPPPMDGVDDLAQRISATFRRTLPALRIASKWLRANFKYVMQDQEFSAFQANEKARGVDVLKKAPHKLSGSSTKLVEFWKTYSQFIFTLSQAFPAIQLPSFNAPLEEDIEMRGWRPLRNLMDERSGSGNGATSAGGPAQTREQVHPNVEQLMRIADLLADAQALVAMENSPLQQINNHILFNLNVVEDDAPSAAHPEIGHATNEPIVPIRQQQLLATIRDTSLDLHPKHDADDDQMTELTSRTDDEVVRDAFKFLNASDVVEDEDEQDDEIVWDPRASISPVLSPSLHATPLTPVKPMLSPKNLSPRSPTHYSSKPSFNMPTPGPPATATTAQDLLNDVMGGFNGSRSLNGNPPTSAESTAPQPQFLFGSELSHRPSQSIWAASLDEQPLRYSGHGSNPNQPQNIYQTPIRPFASPPAQDLSQQSIWASSYPIPSQNSQQHLVGALPSATFSQPPQPMLSVGHHQRVPSSYMPQTLYASQSHPSHIQQQQDPFGYSSPTISSPIIQPPVHRPEQSIGLAAGYIHSPIIPLVGDKFYGNPSLGMHSRQLSMHDPRVGQQHYAHASVPQVWSNTG